MSYAEAAAVNGRPIKNCAKSCPKATVDESVLRCRTQLLPLKENCPVEFLAENVFNRYCRKSPPNFRVWLPLMVTQVGKTWNDWEGRRSAPVPVNPICWNE